MGKGAVILLLVFGPLLGAVLLGVLAWFLAYLLGGRR